jgi:hypothetical protein
VIDEEAQRSGEVAVFTNEDEARAAMGAELVAEPDISDQEIGVESTALTAQVTLGGYVNLHEHIDYGGATWAFYPSWGAIPDFRRVYPTLWWFTNINDRVSSIDVNVNADPPGTVAWVILYRDINFGGDQLWTSSSYSYDDGGGGMRRNLVSIGWNDAASSLRYGYSL